MSDTVLETIDIEPANPARACVIWLHGLGADGHDFEPIVPQLRLPAEPPVRFVFPNAPTRPVTINSGMIMRAWYDVLGIDLPQREDEYGIYNSERLIQELIRREQGRGIPSERIVLAGFSQGGAMALHTGLRYPERLGGIMALSCYVPLARRLDDERHPVNVELPIFIAHGRHDGVIPLVYGRAAYEQTHSLGYRSEWREYNMAHEVCWEEVKDIGRWLAGVVAGEARR